jgi:hypothetical protein
LALSSSSNAGVGNTGFVNTITGLLPGTKYFARAYIINCYGTIYGDELCFYTANPIIGLNQVCSGVEVVYSVKPINGVASYNWTLPPGWIARTSLTGNEIRVVTNTIWGKISVSTVNDCQITSFTSKFENGTVSAQDQAKKNVEGIQEHLTGLDKTNVKVTNFDTTFERVLTDSDINILKENYNYLFWSILAAGTVIVSMNVLKGQPQ